MPFDEIGPEGLTPEKQQARKKFIRETEKREEERRRRREEEESTDRRVSPFVISSDPKD